MVDALQYEYIIVGSGAGGAVVAGRLALAGYKVLVLEAGGDPLSLQGDGALGRDRMPEDYSVPAFHAMATENEAIRWDMWVRHYGDDVAQARDPKYYPVVDGVLYPRASALGGCTTHHAMIMVCPHDSDWDEIAESVGDASWRANSMRRYFERIENCHYRRFWRLIYKVTGWNFLRHGFSGWLSIEKALPIAVVRDKALPDIIVASASRALKELRHPIRRLRELFLAKLDPNDGRIDDQAEGIYYAPLGTSNHERKGPREFLLDIANKYPDRLTIELDALVTKVLLDKSKRAIGVHYLKGAQLYRACPVRTMIEPERRTEYVSREVILSAGAFNTPQILILSGIGPREELAKTDINVGDWLCLPGVGRNLQDRYEVGVVYRLKDEWDVLKGSDFTRNDPQYNEWARARTGVYTTNGVALAIKKRSAPWQRLPDLFLFALIGQFRGYFPGYSRVPHNKYLTWVILKAHTENRAGRVRLRSNDPRDPPLINFHYFKEGTNEGQRDLESVVNGIEFVRKLTAPVRDIIETEELPGEHVQQRQALERWVESQAWGHHASCTCKIGPDGDEMAVLDKSFCVRGTKGLRVVDASVFPRIPGFFIVTSVYMIAEKASDVILADAEAHMAPRNPSECRDQSRPDEPAAARVMRLIWPTAGIVALLALLALLLINLVSFQAMETVGVLSQQLERLSFLPWWAFPLLIVILGFNFTLTLVHSIQESNGRLWRYFGAIAGVRFPEALGLLLFIFLLTLVLWALGFIAIIGHPFIGDSVRMAAAAGLIGARLSDRWYSHVKLDRLGYRPNPGLSSTRYYLVEAIILAVLFLKGLWAHWPYATIGFLIGWGFFYAVLPGLRLLRAFAALRQDPWRAGEPIPPRAH